MNALIRLAGPVLCIFGLAACASDLSSTDLGKGATTRPSDPTPRRDQGNEVLPEISVEVLGPITKLEGHKWPRGYDWVYERKDQLVNTTAADKPHELVLRLPSGRTIRHISKATVFSQERGTVIRVSLLPHPGLLKYQETLTLLELIAKEWDAELDEPSKKSLGKWKAEGDLQPWQLAQRLGGAAIRGEDKVGMAFEIRPGDSGWFLIIDVAAHWDQVRRIVGLPEPAASQPATKPSNKPR